VHDAPGISWRWSAAWLGALFALPAAIVTLRDPSLGLALAFGAVPAAAVGITPARRSRHVIVPWVDVSGCLWCSEQSWRNPGCSLFPASSACPSVPPCSPTGAACRAHARCRAQLQRRRDGIRTRHRDADRLDVQLAVVALLAESPRAIAPRASARESGGPGRLRRTARCCRSADGRHRVCPRSGTQGLGHRRRAPGHASVRPPRRHSCGASGAPSPSSRGPPPPV
jgi:hypothetical protein